MAVIFFASTDLLSSERTSRFIGPFLRWLKPEISDEGIIQVQLIVRKSGHLTEYAILCALLWRALQQPSEEPFVHRPANIREGRKSSARSWTAAALCRFLGARQKRRRAGALQDAGATQPAPCRFTAPIRAQSLKVSPSPEPERRSPTRQQSVPSPCRVGDRRSIPRLALWPWRRAVLALALAVFYAITDEFHQSLTSSRLGSGIDVAIDTCGAALGLALIWGWGRFQQRW